MASSENPSIDENLTEKPESNLILLVNRDSKYENDDNYDAMRSDLEDISVNIDNGREEENELFSKEMEEQTKKRNLVLMEIWNSEVQYYKGLIILEEAFMKPLKNCLNTPQEIINSKTLKVIFSNLEPILSLTGELLVDLNNRLFYCKEKTFSKNLDVLESKIFVQFEEFLNNIKKSESKEEIKLGDIFCNMAPFFKIYSTYSMNFNKAIQTVSFEIEHNINFKNFIQDQILQEKDILKDLSFQSYLILPVQRITRYKMLLEDLLNKTTKKQEDFSLLSRSFGIASEMALFVNESIRQNEMFLKMFDIQRNLNNLNE
ncbi:hypothetical protein HK099_002597, partial [Clydaea vesicula]